LKSLKLIVVLAFVASLLAGCNDGDSTLGGSAAASSSSSSTGSGAPASSGTATLSWQAPTTTTNGAALTNLAGYRVYYGLSESNLNQTIPITTVGLQTYVIDDLAPGTWYFAIRAVTTAGVESALSDVVSLTIS
jgi:ABC-type oligopeptide transport system substrate-binding subunit